MELLEEGGPSAVTMEGVAARAGVGKPTVYRWWPDRHAVAMAALMEAESRTSPARRARPALDALRQQLLDLSEVFSSRTGRNVAALVAAAEAETELSKAFRNHFVLARREEGRALLRDAAARGELRRDLDLEVALDLIYGPLFFRLLLGHGPLNEVFVRRLIKEALRGLRGPGRQRRVSSAATDS
jgi:AcrR family transcriptional regulator